MKYLLAILLLSAMSCTSPDGFTYRDVERGMRPNSRVKHEMLPAARYLIAEKEAQHPGQDSLGASQAAKELGLLMVSAYRHGQFCAPWEKKKEEKIKRSSTKWQ